MRNLLKRKFGMLTVERYLPKKITAPEQRVECECACGNKFEVSVRDLLLKKHMSCGCVKTVHLENELLTYLDRMNLSYVLDFQVCTIEGAEIILDLVVLKDNGYIIKYDQELIMNPRKRPNISTDEIIKTTKASQNQCLKLAEQFDLPVLFIRYEDVDRLEEILGAFFGL